MEPRVTPGSGGFATRAIHAAAVPEVAQRPVSVPIHPSSTWVAERSSDIGALLEDELDGYVYGRYDNPTNTALHAQVASLHGTEAAWSCASGTAAIHATVEGLRARHLAAGGGGRILATSRLYGGTWAMFRHLSTTAGWDVDHVDLTRPAALDGHLTEDLALVYAETIANPTTAITDLEVLADRCRGLGVSLVVDNTFASPWLCRPAELGADVVIESATKYLGGHGDVVAGVVAAPREVVARVRKVTYELGGSLGPFEAWLVSRGIQTLELRVRRSSESAQVLAETLESWGVGAVHYPGLSSHPQHELAKRQFGGRGAGGILALELPDRAVAERFADRCRVFSRAASLGGTRSLVLHPASTSHRQLDEDALVAAGVAPGLVRLSVGIEDADDLVSDVQQALGGVA